MATIRCRYREVASLVILLLGTAPVGAADPAAEPATRVDRVIRLVEEGRLAGVYTWLQGTGRDDPKEVFTVRDGVIRISGDGFGYIATNKAYRDFRLVAQYKWGARTDGSKYVRNSGILLNGIGPDGAANGRWMTSVECQLAQGCEGDLIVIQGADHAANRVPATVSCETRIAADGKTRWMKGGTKIRYSGRQFWWSRHDPKFEELLDTRGRFDVASPLGEWTRVECVCHGDTIRVKINGVTVNEAFDVRPRAGKVLLQSEGNEIYFRNVALYPLAADASPAGG